MFCDRNYLILDFVGITINKCIKRFNKKSKFLDLFENNDNHHDTPPSSIINGSEYLLPTEVSLQMV